MLSTRLAVPLSTAICHGLVVRGVRGHYVFGWLTFTFRLEGVGGGAHVWGYRVEPACVLIDKGHAVLVLEFDARDA